MPPAGVALAPATPEPPADLPEPAAVVWRALIDDLHPNLRRPADLELLRSLCIAAHRARQATELIERHGVLVKGDRGPIVNPLTRLERDATMTVVRLSEQLGLAVAARMRLGLVIAQGMSLTEQLRAEIGERD